MNRNGFSLVELLVVVAVVSLLMAIAFPVLRQSRSHGRDVVCASNLRQITVAAVAYAQENKTFPHGFCRLTGYGGTPPTGMHGDASYDWQGWWWFDFLADWLGTDAGINGPLWCPSRNVLRGLDTDHVLCGNYGINTSICRIASQVTESDCLGRPMQAGQIANPASAVLVCDTGYALISWKSLSPEVSRSPFEFPARQNVYYLPGAQVNQSRIIHPDLLTDAVEGRHIMNKVNVGYADGHIDYQRPQTLSPDFDADGRPWRYFNWSSFKYR
ncbi:MAG: prepilin-type N-terminal cleavage/methylation domain-containing protein [Planctomycetaceae bacterium]|nr:prepilin-type N-terminal cleavage/methylation domain-containing protein [Planctomycetaceae bacterium]